MPVVFEADGNAELAGVLFDLTASSENGKQETVVGHFQNQAGLALGHPTKLCTPVGQSIDCRWPSSLRFPSLLTWNNLKSR